MMLSTNETTFIQTCLEEGKRIDGRRMHDVRDIKINFPTDLGTAEVMLGQTRALAVVSSEIVRPRQERPTEGFFVFNVNITSMSQPNVERNTALSSYLSSIIERGIKGSRAVDEEALCIVAGEKVWSIHTDIHILDNGGNIIDCAFIGCITALLHFRRPDINIVGDEVTIYSPSEREPVPLSIHHVPISTTFGFFGKDKLIVDPTSKEEIVVNGTMTITTNVHSEICLMQKSGGVPIEMELIMKCSRIAFVKSTEIHELIKKSIELDSEQRNSKEKDRINQMRLQGRKVDTSSVFGVLGSGGVMPLGSQNENGNSSKKVSPILYSDNIEEGEEVLVKESKQVERVRRKKGNKQQEKSDFQNFANQWGKKIKVEDGEPDDVDHVDIETTSATTTQTSKQSKQKGQSKSQGKKPKKQIESDSEEEEVIIFSPEKTPQNIKIENLKISPEPLPDVVDDWLGTNDDDDVFEITPTSSTNNTSKSQPSKSNINEEDDEEDVDLSKALKKPKKKK